MNQINEIMEDKRQLYQLDYNGSHTLIQSISDLLAIVENEIIGEGFEIGEELTISKIEMSQKKYESLPEFEGW